VCYGGLGNVSYKAAQDLGAVNQTILSELLVGLKDNKAENVDLEKVCIHHHRHHHYRRHHIATTITNNLHSHTCRRTV
jgi:hypothetical protein